MNGRNLLIAAGFGLLLLITATLQERDAETPAATRSGPIPDARMTGVDTTAYDTDGRPQSRLVTPELTHFEDDDLSLLQTPEVTLHDAGGPAWTAVAESGRLTDDSRVITLEGPARIDGVARAGRTPLRVDTADLRIDSRQRTADTDAAVAITRPDLTLTAVGMRARLEEAGAVIQLLDHVEGRHAPTIR